MAVVTPHETQLLMGEGLQHKARYPESDTRESGNSLELTGTGDHF